MEDYKELIERLISASERNSNSLNTRSTCKDAADAIEQLVKERDEWMEYAKQERKRSIERYHELAVELDRVKKERDSAVKDMNTLCSTFADICSFCKNDSRNDGDVCVKCKGTDWLEFWEWRGVQEVEHETD